MKTILITGLDGSGKSTVLSRLAALPRNGAFDFLFLPHIQAEDFQEDEHLYQLAQTLNALGRAADEKAMPVWKALALFGAMLLYKPLAAYKQARGARLLFCERHPLVDTIVYARFYAGRLNPQKLPPALLLQTDAQWGPALQVLLGRLPAGALPETTSPAEALLIFIYSHFHVQKRWSPTDMKMLFEVPFPDEMYYLRAKPETLMERLDARATREAHESLDALRLLELAYDFLLDKLPLPVNVVDAEHFSLLDAFYETMRNRALQPN